MIMNHIYILQDPAAVLLSSIAAVFFIRNDLQDDRGTEFLLQESQIYVYV
jgi:hypothetical protein